DLNLRQIIQELQHHEAITREEEKQLLEFNSKIRNNYLHYNIQKLVKDMILAELPAVEIRTGNVSIEKNVKVADRPFLWFSAKRTLDKETMVKRVEFCISWANKLLLNEKVTKQE
ncbi:MAG: hypothetical protein ACREHC_02615, partial [Candidatus Levyibacteriota bacterium]